MTNSFDELGATTSLDALAARFGDQDWWEQLCEVAAQRDAPAAVRLIDGPLELEGDLRTGADPWAIVVDGPLTLHGTLECFTDDGRASMLVVTGSVRADNLFFGGAAQVSVAVLELSGFLIGTWGDGGAWLSARAALRARGVLLDAHTPAYGHPLAAIVMAGHGFRDLVPDVIDGESSLFAAEVRERGGPFLDFRAARSAAKAGRPLFDPEQEALWRARKGL
ncbi:MAG TPA: hypothetical protein VFZ61_30720 [Polyangiales bacterium]